MRNLPFKLRSSIVIALWQTLAAHAADNPGNALIDGSAASSSTLRQSSSPAAIVHAAASPGRLRKIALDVTINGQRIAYAVVFYQNKEGRLYADKKALDRLRINDVELRGVQVSGGVLYPLDEQEKFVHAFDETAQALEIQVAPEHVHITRMPSVPFEKAAHIEVSQGWFLNYDANLFGASDQRNQFTGLAEGGAPLAEGLFVMSAIADSAHGRPTLARNQTYWVRDEPDQLRSLRIGDSVGRSRGWGRSVPFAGIQWGTNYALRPYEVPFGLPTLSSQAAVPSNVDVYVNGVLQARKAVPYGPFEITDIPATSGAGQINAVIRDAEGNEQRISLPYYVSAGLLKEGTEEYHAEFGFPRRFGGGINDKYGKAFAVYGHRYGVSSNVTAGTRVEAQADRQAAGIDVNQKIFNGVIFETSLAASRSEAGAGYTGALALEKASTDYSVRVSAQWLSPRFRQLGLPDDALADRSRMLGSFSFSPTGLDALTASHSIIRRIDGSEEKTSQLYYRLPSWGALNTSLFYSKFHSDGGKQYVGIQFSYMLDSHHYVNAGASRQSGQETALTTDYSKTVPSGNGYGYRLSAVHRGDQPASANGALQIKSDLTSYSLDVGQNGRNNYYRLGVKGSMAGVGSDLLLAREIQDSFAVVKIGNFPNVRVLHENQTVARTNEDGVALIPNLRAYEVNRIGFVETDLPLTVSVENTQKMVAPRYRSGTYVYFPVKTDKHVHVKVVHPEFKKMPFGSLAAIEGVKEKFALASNGELYLPNLERNLAVTVSYKNQKCAFSLDLPKTDQALIRLGTVTCR